MEALLKLGGYLLGISGFGTCIAGTTAPTENVWLKLCVALLGVIAAMAAVILTAFITHVSNHGKNLVSKDVCKLQVGEIKSDLRKIMKHFKISEQDENADSD